MNIMEKYEVSQLCEKCKQFKPLEDVIVLKSTAKNESVCIDCLIGKTWKYLKRNVRCDDYGVVMSAKMRKEGGFVPDRTSGGY